MRSLGRRFSSVLTLLAIGALCANLQHVPIASAKDKAKSSAKTKARPETAKKKKGVVEETSDPNQGSSATNNASGGGSIPAVPGGQAGGTTANSKPGDNK